MKKILIIEDDDTLLQLYTQILQDDGYTVLTAQEGKTGLTKALQETPDLLLLDIMLPGGLNGFDVLERVKKTEAVKNVPVIVMTNLSTEEAMARKMGAADYVLKTEILPDALLAKIEALVGKPIVAEK